MTQDFAPIDSPQAYISPHKGSSRLITSGRTPVVIFLTLVLLIGILFISIVPLNYFGVFPASLMFPKILGFLPDQNTVPNQASTSQLSSYLSDVRKSKFSKEIRSTGNVYTIDGIYSGYGTNLIQMVTIRGKENFTVSDDTKFSQIEKQQDPNTPGIYFFAEGEQTTFSRTSINFGDPLRVSYVPYQDSKIIVHILLVPSQVK